jgi:hypothetical protein
MWTKKLYRFILLVLMECGLFTLFVTFYADRKDMESLGLVTGIILLALLLVKWGEGEDDNHGSLSGDEASGKCWTSHHGAVYPICLSEKPLSHSHLLTAGLYAILALGLNFQLGSTNVVNLATAASYGIGRPY